MDQHVQVHLLHQRHVHPEVAPKVVGDALRRGVAQGGCSGCGIGVDGRGRPGQVRVVGRVVQVLDVRQRTLQLEVYLRVGLQL